MAEAVIRQRLIRLSCAKLLAFKKSSEGLRRSLQVLTVLKHAHSDDARFEPECSDLLHPQQPNRLVVILEHAPPQRIHSSSSSSHPSTPPPTSATNEHIVPSMDVEPVELYSSVDETMMEMDDNDCENDENCEDGTSMARKRKNHTRYTFLDYGEKRHCENNTNTNTNSSPSGTTTKATTSPSSTTTTSKSLDIDNNNNNNH